MLVVTRLAVHAIRQASALLDRLKAEGTAPDAISIVVNCHRSGLFARGDVSGLLFGLFVALDDVDAHFGQHGERIFDGLGGHFLAGQHLVQLVHSDVAAGLGLFDELLDPGVGQVEQRPVLFRGFGFRRFGGGFIVDFVGLEGRGAREKVRQAMAAALAGDPAAPQVLGWTRLGHLEIVRPRRGCPLSEAMLEPQGFGKSSLALAFEALRLVQREARANPAADWLLVVSPAIEAALRS